MVKSFRFIFICFVGRSQAVATLGTYDIAFELGKKVICQRYVHYPFGYSLNPLSIINSFLLKILLF